MKNNRKIKLYGLSTCGHCRSLRKLLEERGCSFDYVDVDLLEGKERRDMLDEVRQYNKRCSFPTVVIGDRAIVGFIEKEIIEALAD